MAQEGFLIGALTQIIAHEISKRVHEGYKVAGFGDISPAYDPVFKLLKPEGDRVADLAKRAEMSKQAMGYLVTYLEARGYVERVPHPTDGRAQLVRRTDRGWEVNRTARRLVQEIQDDWARQLDHDEMEQLVVLLRKLVRLIGVEYVGSLPEIVTKNR
jgi:DNA-binding MarR family transcriptional regulator